jgi:hypothetical protein
MIIDPNNEKHLIAEEGKLLARIKDMRDTYLEVWLGYYTDENGVREMDTKENFTEINMPEPDVKSVEEA